MSTRKLKKFFFIKKLKPTAIGSIISRVDGNFPQPYFSVYKKANIRYIKIAKPNTKG